MNTPSEPPPPRVLTPRRKRAFLSFRRKSDLLWFLSSLVMFSGGSAAFVLAFTFIRRAHEPIPGSIPTVPSPVAAPLPPTTPPPPPLSRPIERPKPPAKVVEERRRPLVSKASVPPPAPVVVEAPGYSILRHAGPFKTLFENQAKISLERIESVGEPALQLTYDISQGDWVQCFVNVREDFSKYSRVQFLFKGEGANNTLEFKLVDSDGTNVGAFWPQQTGNKAWTVVDLPLSDLSYLWGGDSSLDLKRVRQIFFAVSKKRGDKGGWGRVFIRGIKIS